MPKRVAPDLLSRWRRLAADGGSYKKIGKDTGWDERTVAKYLKSDVRVAEIVEIRKDLLKERLGRHWDMLIEETRQQLTPLKALDPWEQIGRARESSATEEFTISGASVSPGPGGAYLVQANARRTRACQLLEEHLPHDPLWGLVSRWEEAVASDLRAQRALYALAAPALQTSNGWPIQRGRDSNEMSWRPAAVDLVFEEGLVRACGIPRHGFATERCRETDDGMIDSAGSLVAYAPGECDRACTAIEQTIDQIANAGEAKKSALARKEAGDVAEEIRLLLDDLRLLTYLPGICAVCGRLQL